MIPIRNITTIVQALHLSDRDQDVRFHNKDLANHARLAGREMTKGWHSIPESRQMIYDVFASELKRIEGGQNLRIPRRLQKRLQLLVKNVDNLRSHGNSNRPLNGKDLHRLSAEVVDVTAQIQHFRGQHGQQSSRTTRPPEHIIYDSLVYDAKKDRVSYAQPKSVFSRAFKGMALHFSKGRHHYARKASADIAQFFVRKYGIATATKAFKRAGVNIEEHLAHLSGHNPATKALSHEDVRRIQDALLTPWEAENQSSVAENSAKNYQLNGKEGETIKAQLTTDQLNQLQKELPTVPPTTRASLFQTRFQALMEERIEEKGITINADKEQQKTAIMALQAWRNLASLSDEKATELINNDRACQKALFEHADALQQPQGSNSMKAYFQSLQTINHLSRFFYLHDPILGAKTKETFSEGDSRVIQRMLYRPLRNIEGQKADVMNQRLFGAWGHGLALATGITHADAGDSLDKTGKPVSLFFPYENQNGQLSQEDLLDKQFDHLERHQVEIGAHETNFYFLSDMLQPTRINDPSSSHTAHERTFRHLFSVGQQLRQDMPNIQNKDDALVALASQAAELSGLSQSEQRMMLETMVDYAKNSMNDRQQLQQQNRQQSPQENIGIIDGKET